jgi:hypothetical protein
MSAEPRYETAYEQQQRIGYTDSVICMDCGVFVMNRAVHTRFHSILSSHAWALAILKTRHIAASVHDKYDVVERIDSKQFDNWSADALAEVVAASRPDGEPRAGEPGGGEGGQDGVSAHGRTRG